MYDDPDPPPKEWPLTFRSNLDGTPPNPAQYNDPDYFGNTTGYADPDPVAELGWTDPSYDSRPKGQHLPILGDPSGDADGSVDGDFDGGDSGFGAFEKELANATVGRQDCAEPYSRHQTIDCVHSVTAHRPVNKTGWWEDVMIARVSRTDEERGIEESERKKIALTACSFEAQITFRPVDPDEHPLRYECHAQGLLPRTFNSTIYRPCAFPKKVPDPVSIPVTDWPRRERDGLHRTETFKLVGRVGREVTQQERVAALLVLSTDPEFLRYIDPYPDFLEPPRRTWRLELYRAESFSPVWATQKWTRKGRRYFSDDPAEGALALDGTVYVLDKPFDTEEAEYRRLRLTGLRHREIAERLGVGVQTVKNHLAGISTDTVHRPTDARDALRKPTAHPTRPPTQEVTTTATLALSGPAHVAFGASAFFSLK